MRITYKGNFDTGDLDICADGNEVISLTLNELNQNKDQFVAGMHARLVKSYQLTYKAGRESMKAEIMRQVINVNEN